MDCLLDVQIDLELIKGLIADEQYQQACVNWGLIEDAFALHNIADIYNLAGICATVAVETGLTFCPIEEDGGASYFIRMYWSNPYVRKQLGNTSPADAINYHGRGYIQLTGKFNYVQASEALDMSLWANPGLACDPNIAAKVLWWFWTARKLDKLCGSVSANTPPEQKLMVYQQVRRLVNGGLNGLNLYMEVLNRLDVI